MLLRFKLRLLRFLQDHRRSRVARRIGSLASTVYRAFEHPGYDPATNGESGLLRTLQGADLKLALDVGANHGDWTNLLRQYHPGVYVHLFELALPTFKILAQNYAFSRNLTLHQHGLGDSTRHLRLHYYPSQDGLSSATWSMHQRPSEIIDGYICRGDEWAAKNNFAMADIMKIDVEGMELEVLRGFGSIIQRGNFRFIQFEHHGGRALLHDFYSLLEPAGYLIGKIFSRYVQFSPYDQSLENGIGPNFIAVRKDQSVWFERLSRGWKNHG